MNYLFKIYLFHTITSFCLQMLCYSRCVHHVCFGVNGPITAQLSNRPWQWSGIAWSHLLLSFTFPYINWPIIRVRTLYISRITNHISITLFRTVVLAPLSTSSLAVSVCSSSQAKCLWNINRIMTLLFRVILKIVCDKFQINIDFYLLAYIGIKVIKPVIICHGVGEK